MQEVDKNGNVGGLEEDEVGRLDEQVVVGVLETKSVVRAEAGDVVSDGGGVVTALGVERSELLSLHSALGECFVKLRREFGFLT